VHGRSRVIFPRCFAIPERATPLSIAKRLALITVGYALSVAGGLAAVTANEAFMLTEIAQTSGGMVAFGEVRLGFWGATDKDRDPGRRAGVDAR
jgi:hypothetical protein